MDIDWAESDPAACRPDLPTIARSQGLHPARLRIHLARLGFYRRTVQAVKALADSLRNTRTFNYYRIGIGHFRMLRRIAVKNHGKNGSSEI